MTEPGRIVRLGIALACATVIIDQASKIYVRDMLRLPDALEPLVLAPFLELKFTWNKGISYGLFQQDGGIGRWLLVGLSVAAVVLIGIWMTRIRSVWTASALGLIAGGAIGNALDRARFGAVVDFLHLHVGTVPWLDFPYIFNVADAAISIGVVLLFLESFFARSERLEPGRDTR